MTSLFRVMFLSAILFARLSTVTITRNTKYRYLDYSIIFDGSYLKLLKGKTYFTNYNHCTMAKATKRYCSKTRKKRKLKSFNILCSKAFSLQD